MKICAALAWFDEPVAFLERIVGSLAGTVDHLVALDGRWDGYPDERDLSPMIQIEALERAPLPVAVVSGRSFQSQVAKRDLLMRLAAEDADWVLVIDGDEWVEECDRDALERELAATASDVGTVALRNLNRPRPYSALGPLLFAPRRLYRAGTTVTGPAHNDYRIGDIRVNGDPVRGALAPAVDVSGLIVISHDNANRGRARNDAAAGYRRTRRRIGVEVPA